MHHRGSPMAGSVFLLVASASWRAIHTVAPGFAPCSSMILAKPWPSHSRYASSSMGAYQVHIAYESANESAMQGAYDPGRASALSAVTFATFDAPLPNNEGAQGHKETTNRTTLKMDEELPDKDPDTTSGSRAYGAGTLYFEPPVHVAPPRGPGQHPSYAAGFHTLLKGNSSHNASIVFIGVSGSNGMIYSSSDGAHSWHVWGSDTTTHQAPNAGLRSTLVSPRPGVLHTSGWIGNMAHSKPLRIFQGKNVTYFKVGSKAKIERSFVAEQTSFASLPVPLECGGGDCFRTSGSSAIQLPDRSWLQTTVVPFLGGTLAKRAAAGVYAWRSNDTLRWTYSGAVITSAQFPKSGEGPNENSISIAADGQTLVAVVRMDAGDGLAWGDHRTKNYYRAESRDWGTSWSRATEMRDTSGRGVGCARPRLLLLRAGGPLLLSGGRLTTESMTGIFLWVSSDGFGHRWDQVHSLSYQHNLLQPLPMLKFPETVNTTLDLEGCKEKGRPYPDCPANQSRLSCPAEYKYKNCSTTGYTSLLAGGDNNSAVVIYDGPSGIFSMRLTWRDCSTVNTIDGSATSMPLGTSTSKQAALKTDEEVPSSEQAQASAQPVSWFMNEDYSVSVTQIRNLSKAASPASIGVLPSPYSFVWGAQPLHMPAWKALPAKVQPLLSWYMPYSRDISPASCRLEEPSTGRCLLKGRNISWYLEHRKSWVLFKCDKKTPSYQYGDPNVPLDFTNPDVIEYQATLAAVANEKLAYGAVAADNLAFDNFKAFNACGIWKDGVWKQLFSGAAIDPVFAQATAEWPGQFRAALRRRTNGKMKLVVNFDVDDNSMHSAKVCNNSDGVLDEFGFQNIARKLGSGGDLAGTWLAKVQWMSQLEKIGIQYFSNNYLVGNATSILNASDIEWVMASYMMGAGLLSSLLVTPWNNAHVGRFVESSQLRAGVGTALAPMEKVSCSDSCTYYRRNYTHAVALVNPGSNNSVSVALDPEWTYHSITPEGGVVSPLSPLVLCSQCGRVLLRMPLRRMKTDDGQSSAANKNDILYMYRVQIRWAAKEK